MPSRESPGPLRRVSVLHAGARLNTGWGRWGDPAPLPAQTPPAARTRRPGLLVRHKQCVRDDAQDRGGEHPGEGCYGDAHPSILHAGISTGASLTPTAGLEQLADPRYIHINAAAPPAAATPAEPRGEWGRARHARQREATSPEQRAGEGAAPDLRPAQRSRARLSEEVQGANQPGHGRQEDPKWDRGPGARCCTRSLQKGCGPARGETEAQLCCPGG